MTVAAPAITNPFESEPPAWASHSATALLALFLLSVALIDLRTRRIPNLLNLAIALLGLAVTWLLGRDLIAALIGMAAGYGVLFVLSGFYFRARGRDGIGLGDAKLMGAAGAWIGWMGLPFVLLLGSSLGLISVAIARLRGERIDGAHAIAFGPYLCAAIFVVWLVLIYYRV